MTNRKLAVGCLAFIAVAVLALFAFVAIFRLVDPAPPETFSSGAWQRFSRERTHMARDLADRHLLADMQREKVLDLLGRPAAESTSSVVYYSGLDSLGEEQWLRVDFGRDGRVDEVHAFESGPDAQQALDARFYEP